MKAFQKTRKIKVLGYPFAGGQNRSGVELTPSWLENQFWFKNMANLSNGNIEYEEIKVSDPTSNLGKDTVGHLPGPRNELNVMRSSTILKRQTYKALKEGYFPIVLGGDHSQAIGSIAGFKHMYPNDKILWLDAHLDANTPKSSPSGNAHGMPLSYLIGQVPLAQQWKCVDLKDITYFGIRSFEDDEA